MITVGLVKELHFIAKVTNETYLVEFVKEGTNAILKGLTIRVNPNGELDVWYRMAHIWNEMIEGVDSFFGVESCDNISRIINCINSGDNAWRSKYYYNQSKEKS